MSYTTLQPNLDRPVESFEIQPSRSPANLFEIRMACRDAVGAEKVNACIEFMKQRLDQPMQASTLASKVNVSQSHFFALFKRITGRTPIDYFNDLRIRKACDLLLEPMASVKGVAADVGYDDPFYFSRVFKAVQGVSPSEYQRRFAVRGQERIMFTSGGGKNHVSG